MAACLFAVVCTVGSDAHALPTATCPSGQPCVIVQVVPESGAEPDPVVVTRQQILDQQDVDNSHVGTDCTQACGAYQTRTPTGTYDDPDTVRGISIRALAGLAGAAPDSVSGAVIAAPTGTARLTRSASEDDFADPADPSTGAFPFEHALVPVFYLIGNGSIGYLRPLRDNADLNYLDYFQTYDGGSMRVTLQQSGALLHPVVRPSTTSPVSPGATVGFTGSTGDGTAADDARTWKWHITGGIADDDHGTQTSVTFPSAGTTYYVWADVSDTTSSGQSPHVAVTVRPTKTSTSPSPPSTTTGRSTSSGAGSKTPVAPPGSSHGNGSSVNPIGGPADGSGHQGGGAPTPGLPGGRVGPAGGSISVPATDTSSRSATASGSATA